MLRGTTMALSATVMALAPVAAAAAPVDAASTTVTIGADARASSAVKHHDGLTGGSAAILGVVLVGGIAAILAVGLTHTGNKVPNPASP